jgi:hypothetical protein
MKLTLDGQPGLAPGFPETLLDALKSGGSEAAREGGEQIRSKSSC